eukprot:scaffold3.g6275.t1
MNQVTARRSLRLSSAPAASSAGEGDAALQERLAQAQTRADQLESRLQTLGQELAEAKAEAAARGEEAEEALQAAAAEAEAARLAEADAEAARVQLQHVQRAREEAEARHSRELGALQDALAAATEAVGAQCKAAAELEAQLAAALNERDDLPQERERERQHRMEREEQEREEAERRGQEEMERKQLAAPQAPSPAVSTGSVDYDALLLQQDLEHARQQAAAAATTTFVVLGSPGAGVDHEELREQCALLQANVAALEERLTASHLSCSQLQSELQMLLAAKEEAARQLAATTAELGSLRRSHALLEEHAGRLQQEVSALQHEASEQRALEEQQALEERPSSRSLSSRLSGLVRPHHKSSPPDKAVASRGGSFTKPDGLPHPPACPGSPSLDRELASLRVQAELRGARVAELEAELAGAQGAAEERGAALQGRLDDALDTLASWKARADQQVEVLSRQLALAEQAADSVLSLHAAEVDLGEAPGDSCSTGAQRDAAGQHAKCREMILALHASLWRERLARQRQEAAAQGLLPARGPVARGSSPAGSVCIGKHGGSTRCSSADAAPSSVGQGTSSGAPTVTGRSTQDEALAVQLQRELGEVDQVAEGLASVRRHQQALAGRLEAMELQVADWDSLLEAAAAVKQVPPMSPTRASASPKRRAITSLQLRKLSEESAELGERLRALEAELASHRRREREAGAWRRTLLDKHAKDVETLRSRWHEEAAARETAEARLRASARAMQGLAQGVAMLSAALQRAEGGAAGGVPAPAGELSNIRTAMIRLSGLLRAVHGQAALVSPELSEGPLLGVAVHSRQGGSSQQSDPLELDNPPVLQSPPPPSPPPATSGMDSARPLLAADSGRASGTTGTPGTASHPTGSPAGTSGPQKHSGQKKPLAQRLAAGLRKACTSSATLSNTAEAASLPHSGGSPRRSAKVGKAAPIDPNRRHADIIAARWV